MNLFFSVEIDKSFITLSEDESKHLLKVMRAGQGDTIFVTDGKGNLFKTTIAENKSKKCLLNIIEVIPRSAEPNYNLHIAIAPTKNHDRLEWFTEKATEMGITEITPVICRHSERKNIHSDRLERLLISAMKQSGRFFLPKLNPVTSFGDFISQNFKSGKYIASCLNEEKKSLKQIYQPGSNAVILIGPEGDFSAEEIAEAKIKTFIPVSLGRSRYRTETAALVACHTIVMMNE